MSSRGPDARVLDLCCGTGDLALALACAPAPSERSESASPGCEPISHIRCSCGVQRRLPGIAAVRSNFSKRMDWRFPLPTEGLIWSTTAFGFRNLANYAEGLRELRRVLAGGSVAILEFAEPRGALFGHLFRFLFSPRASGDWRRDVRKCAGLQLSAEIGGAFSESE